MRLPALVSLIMLILPGSAAIREAVADRSLPAPGVSYLAPRKAGGSAVVENTFDLSTFGAVGDGVADDGPALQSALNAIANAGGGALFVPAGRYAIITPVQKNFAGLADSVTIYGVESTTPVPPPTSPGAVLTRGLDLVSEFFPKTGQSQNAITISGLESFLVKDIAFVGTPGVSNDALITLSLTDISSATIHHCEFYGLSSLVANGAIIRAVRCNLTFEHSVVLGSTCNSGHYTSVIQNLEWKSITISDAVFADYGQRPELFGKMTTAPYSWVMIGNAAAVNNDSPRREVVFRSVMLDEGGYMAITSLPYRFSPPSAPIDLVYITGLWTNVSNLGTTGHYLTSLKNAFIEKSHYGWSHNTYSAIRLITVGQAILDEVECIDDADRIAVDSTTGKLTVINSTYTTLDSQAPITNVITTATTDEDPVQHVRQQFMAILGRAPDPAGHFYWSDQILQCGANAECIADKRAALAAYLGSTPSPKFAITGQVLNESGAGMPGVAVTLSGSQTVTTATDSAGQYHFSNLPTSGVYTVTPTLKDHTLNPESRTIVTPAGDQVFDSVATFNHHLISGHIADAGGAAISGVTVTLSGAQAASMTTDVDGNYSFENLPAGGNYTVTPQKTSYKFSPVNRTVPDLGADQNLDFTGAFVTYYIAGKVVSYNNSPLPGVTVNLSGSQSSVTTTNSSGEFIFPDLPSEFSYTTTPKLTGYWFSPASRTFDNHSANRFQTYQAYYGTKSISGSVTITTSGAPLSGAVVALSGSASGATTTDANGNYSFAELTPGGTYTVTVGKTHHTFVPPSQTLANLTTNQTVNFAATLNRHNITGRATAPGGSGLAGVTVTLSGSQAGTTTTDATGNYSFASLPAGGNYTVKPSKTSYSWAPQTLVFNDLGANQTANFTGTFVSHTISGQVTESGAGLSGVSVALSGSQTSTATTDVNGNYSFTLPSEGNYTVTPAKQHYTFTPANLTFNNLAASQTGDFAATRNRHTISGQVVNANNAGLAGITVSLSGSSSGTTTTDLSGNYSFANLSGGGNYTVTATKVHYTFAPPSQTLANLTTNQTVNFAATLDRHNITGRATAPGGSALAGVTVTLSGSQAGTTTTDATGNYSFASLPAGGNYTVTPSLQYYFFTPASEDFANLAASQQASFSATLNTHTISGRVTNAAGSPLAGASVTLSHSTGPSTSLTTDADGRYSFGTLSAGASYVVTVKKPDYSFVIASRSFSALNADQTADFSAAPQNIPEFGQASYSVTEGTGTITITVSRTGDTSAGARVSYSATNGTATQGKDLSAVIGELIFSPAEVSRSFVIFITDDAFVENAEQLTVSLSDPHGAILGSRASATLTINDNDTTAAPNPIDQAQFFVRQHYRDFLNREPDAAGLAFWSNQIVACGTNDACVEDRRINVSAAFFLSIEFQETGFLVHRLYQASFGQPPRYLDQFLLDSRTLAQGVVVHAPGWQEKLEENKTAYLNDFVARQDFISRYPLSLNPEAFVNALNTQAGAPLTAEGLAAAVAEFNGAATSSDALARARVLRRVVVSEPFLERETNPAFVLMQYFGYLQRNPSDPPNNNLDGYNFWLAKLNQFGGDFRRAEMVRAFLVSIEYRSRFGL